MTPALALIPPQQFKTILEKDGYHVEHETELNWTLFKNGAKSPVITIPKKGELVSLMVMMGILNQAEMSNAKYFEYLKLSNN
jgi:hypothetical protein